MLARASIPDSVRTPPIVISAVELKSSTSSSHSTTSTSATTLVLSSTPSLSSFSSYDSETMEASNCVVVCVAVSGQKQSDLRTSSSSWRSRVTFVGNITSNLEKIFDLSFRTTSSLKPVNRASSQPLHTPDIKKSWGTSSPRAPNKNGSSGEKVGDAEYSIMLSNVSLFSVNSVVFSEISVIFS